MNLLKVLPSSILLRTFLAMVSGGTMLGTSIEYYPHLGDLNTSFQPRNCVNRCIQVGSWLSSVLGS